MIRITSLFLLCATAAFADESPAQPAALPRPVVSQIVAENSAAANGFVGTVSARVVSDLGFPLLGTLASRNVAAGDRVTKGEPLARLDSVESAAGQRAAEAGIRVAQAQLRSASEARDRARALVARNVDDQTRLEAAERTFAAAQAGMEQAQATLTQSQDRLANTVLLAPSDGVITEIHAEAGATLSAGQSVLSLAATDQLEVQIDLSERELETVSLGELFDAHLLVAPQVQAQARLLRIDPQAKRSTRTRRLHLELANPGPGFRLGALVRVLPSAKTAAHITLPAAVILDPETTPYVWVVDRSTNTVAKRAVTLGDSFGDLVEISSGVAPGEEVVTKGIHSLQDGQLVAPMVSK